MLQFKSSKVLKFSQSLSYLDYDNESATKKNKNQQESKNNEMRLKVSSRSEPLKESNRGGHLAVWTPKTLKIFCMQDTG